MTNTNNSPAKKSGGKRRLKKDSNGHTKRNVILSVIAAVILIPALVFMGAYIVVDVPEPEELVAPQVSQIYAADGETELARIVPPEGNRQMVAIDQVPDTVSNAVLAAEDREFYTNPGFSITGYARAALGVITGNPSAGGGSTITQQYVKKAVVGDERSLIRKAKELVYSAKMANEWSKDEVLEAYLNTVYFGRNAYGVQAAANAFFGKPVEELNASEGAVLAASIQRPSELDPWTNPSEAESRWSYVMDGMVDIGAITPEERAAATYPETTDPANNRAYTEATGTNGLIKNQVMAELSELGITEEDVQNRGLQVTTTIDANAQEGAVEAVNAQMEALTDNNRAAVVSIDPSNGAVRAYYGGEDATGWDYANAPIQTGSTFKIFGLAAALQQGIPLSQQYSSAPVTTGNVTIGNVNNSGCGTCSIKQALLHSYNTSFIRLQQDLEHGSQDTADMAHALGIAESLPSIPATLTENGETPYEGIILGQYESRPLDMASAMATIANVGVWHRPHFVSKVETLSGEVLYEFEDGEGERRVSEKVALNLLDAMGPIAAYSNGNALADGQVSASKTGTTQLGDTGANKDAWMLGASPQLATAVWVGTADNSPLYNTWGGNMYGSNSPASIWKATMDNALVNEPLETWDSAPALGYGNPPVPEYVWTPSPSTGGGGNTYEEAPVEEAPAEDPNIPAEQPAAPTEDTGAGGEDVEILPGVTIPGDLLGIG
ncbi:Penicillin-binding protein 1A [Corynebacterium deserti GIMN1.010]|uniref:Penicillin-binding protein 1A n=1 Tax=Corynebacterium deserti GIMN1.010 TaxID=931089 RepID=A0A0M4CLJ4_9CORY|nr:transglycosylase domain-containing protein [Corynebacterium deserti]ALC07026.1 Penicillin-binding protein 1A [Corynebacterium deserti GIMN1.010]